MSGLPTSGPLSMDAIHVEAGGSSGSIVTLDDADVRSLVGIASGAIDIASFRGVSASVFDSVNDLPTYATPSNSNNTTYGAGSGGAGDWNMSVSTSSSSGTQYFSKSGGVLLTSGRTYECTYDVTHYSDALRFGTLLALGYTISPQSGFYTSNSNDRGEIASLATITAYQEGSGFSKQTASGMTLVSGSNTGTNRVQGTFTVTAPLDIYVGLRLNVSSNPNGNSQSASATIHSVVLKEV